VHTKKTLLLLAICLPFGLHDVGAAAAGSNEAPQHVKIDESLYASDKSLAVWSRGVIQLIPLHLETIQLAR